MRTLSGQGVPNIHPPSTEYPFGQARDSQPPSARNGTPLLETNVMTDVGYAMLAVMKAAGLNPSEIAENINTSQFLEALLSLIGTVGIPNKVIIDAPDLGSGNVNSICKFSEGLSNDSFNTWVGICESVGKLTVQGIAKVKIINRTGSPVVATAGTHVFAGDFGFFSAGYIQISTGDNSDLAEAHNVIGELAEDFDFQDITTYELVDVAIKGKPLESGSDLWTEDLPEQILLSSQPGIAIDQISSEWHTPNIASKNRIVYAEDAVTFYDSTPKTLNTYINLALNNLGQLVSTNGVPGVLIKSGNGNYGVSSYSPTAGAGSIVVENFSWLFDSDGLLNTNAAIVLGERFAGSTVNGEFWLSATTGKIQSRESSISYEVNNHNSKNNLQGGAVGERFHLTEAQWNAAIRWLFIGQVVDVNPENVYLNENWLGVGDPVQNNWNASNIGIEIGWRHGLVDMLSSFNITSNLYFNAFGYFRTIGSGNYYGLQLQLDSASGTYKLRVSDVSTSTANEEFTMLDACEIGRNFVKAIGSLIAGDRDSGSRENGEIWYDPDDNKLKAREGGGNNDIGYMEQGCLYVKNNTNVTVISAIGEGNKIKFVYFGVAGPSTKRIALSAVNDSITVLDAGVYEIMVSIGADSSGGAGGGTFAFEMFIDSGATGLDMLHTHRTMAGGGSEAGSVAMSGQVELAENDVLELYVWNEDNTQDIILADVSMSIKKLRSV